MKLASEVRRFAGLLAVAAACAAGLAARAQQVEVVRTRCPIDGAAVGAMVPTGAPRTARAADLRPLPPGMDLFILGFIECPRYGFTARCRDFDDPAGLDAEAVRAALAELDAPAVFRKFDRAMLVERLWRDDPHVLAHLALGAKWSADDTGEPEVIRRRTDAALAAHKRALASGELAPQERGAYAYLVGELLRERGERRAALRWFERAAGEDVSPEIAGLIERQRFRARHAGGGPAEVLEAAEAATAEEQVGAVALLRDSEDPAAVAFLERFVGECPERLHQAAMAALLAEGPRRAHVPVYLAAIRQDQPDLVAGGAWAMGRLEASEAVPELVEALLAATPQTTRPLAEAIVAAADGRHLDELARLAEARPYRAVLLRALLAGGSAEAVPLIVDLLDQDGRLAQWATVARDPGLLESAREFPPSRWEELLSNAPERLRPALANLRAAATRDDGRPPVSFESALQAMQGEAERRRADIAQARRRVAELPQERRAEAEERLERLLYAFEQRYFLEPHLERLGRSGDPRARPILLEHLDDANWQVRRGAIRGLAHVYDDEVGDALAARLPREEPWVQTDVVRAIGRAGDARHVDALLALIEQPTLVETKLAWIEAMEALAPDRMGPALRYWATSPDEGLARAARDAVERVEPQERSAS